MKSVWLLALLWLISLTPTAVRAIDSTTSVSVIVPAPSTGALRLIGQAIPSALMTFLDAGSVIGTVTTNSTSGFDRTFAGLSPGLHTISLYAADSQSRTTLTLSVDVRVIGGSTVTLSGFLLPPTISLTKATIKRPEALIAEGYAKNSSSVTAFISGDSVSKQVTSDSLGAWQAKVSDTLHLGNHTTYAVVQDQAGTQSQLSQTKLFSVQLSADLNNDSKVNLTDFSILMFNYGQSRPPNKAADINDNGGAPDLVDFSVMMFYWTG